MEGAISLSNSIHLPPIENSIAVNLVMWPPGRSRLVTNPWPTGVDTETNTIGIVLVASGTQCPHVVGNDGAMKTFELEFSGRFDIGDRFDRHVDLAIDQNLPGVRFPAQPRG